MSIYINDSLLREKKVFEPLNPPKVNIYTCGVTVYDSCHIGHARSLYTFDVIRKYLKYRGFDVKFVRNITDIDDKIINRANELKIDWQDLVKEQIAGYYQDLDILGIPKADYEPRATENIVPMIRHIEALIEKGYAYVTDTGVYFNVRKFESYGKLSGQSIDRMEVGVRKESDETKKDPLDFALWKTSKPGEPSWDSPWGKGRPGWHIECSVMSTKYLKVDTLDIHAGGRDLIFPHHENEIAQAEALTEQPFAKYWIHHGLLTINGQKMAKSLGNFITIKDFIDKHKNADFLKIFFLSAHYAHPVDFTEEKIEEAKKGYERFTILFQKLDRKLCTPDAAKLLDANKVAVDQFRNKFQEAMDDDFNTPIALSVLFNMVNECNKMLASELADNCAALRYARQVIMELTGILGLSFKYVCEENVDTWIDVLLDKRNQFKKGKKYAEADKIRKELEEKGIIIEDTKDGTTWRRKL